MLTEHEMLMINLCTYGLQTGTLALIFIIGFRRWRRERTTFAFLAFAPLLPLLLAVLTLLVLQLEPDCPAACRLFVSYLSMLFFAVIAYAVWNPILWHIQQLRKGIHTAGAAITGVYLVFILLAHTYTSLAHLGNRWIIQAHLFAFLLGFIFILFITMGLFFIWQKSHNYYYWIIGITLAVWTTLLILQLALAPIGHLHYTISIATNILETAFYLLMLYIVATRSKRYYQSIETYFRQAMLARRGLYHQIDLLQAEQVQLSRWNEQLGHLSLLGLSLNEAVEDIPKMMQITAAGIATLIPAERVHVFWIEKEDYEPLSGDVTISAWTQDTQSGKEYRFALKKEPVLQKLLAQVEAISWTEGDTADLFAGEEPIFQGKRVARLQLFPLVARGRPIGALGVDYSRPTPAWTQNQLSELQSAVQLCNSAFANARLLKLIESGKQEWQAAFDSIETSMVILDLDLRIRRANQATIRLLNTTYHEILGKPCYQVFQCQSKKTCPLHAQYEAGGPEALARIADGIWQKPVLLDDLGFPGSYKLRISPVRDATGNVKGIVHSLTDITAEQNLLHETQRSRRNLQDIIDALGDPLLVTDIENRIHHANLAAAQLFTVAPKEISQHNLVRLMRHRFSDLSEVRPAIEKLRQPDETRAIFTLRSTKKDGSTEIWSFSVYKMAEDNRFTVIGHDLTQFHLLQQQAHEKAHQLASVVDNSNEAIISIDRDGRVQSWSRGAEKLLHFRQDEITGQPLSQAFQITLATGEANIWQELQKRDFYDQLAYIQTRDGEQLIVRLSSRPLRDQSGIPISTVIVLHDDTAQVHTTQLLHTLNRIILQVQQTAAEPTEVLPLAIELLSSAGMPAMHFCFDNEGHVQNISKTEQDRFLLGDIHAAFQSLLKEGKEAFFSEAYHLAYLYLIPIDVVLVVSLSHLYPDDKPAFIAFGRQLNNNWQALKLIQKTEQGRQHAEAVAHRLQKLLAFSSNLSNAATTADAIDILGASITSILEHALDVFVSLHDEANDQWYGYIPVHQSSLHDLLRQFAGKEPQKSLRPLHPTELVTTTNIADVLSFAAITPTLLQTLQQATDVHQVINIPLQLGNDLLGTLFVTSRLADMPPEDLDVLQVMAQHIAGTLLNRRILAQLEERVEQGSLLYNIVTALYTTQQAEEAAQIGLDRLLALLNLNDGVLYARDNVGRYRLLAGQGNGFSCQTALARWASSFWPEREEEYRQRSLLHFRRSEVTIANDCWPPRTTGFYFLPLPGGVDKSFGFIVLFYQYSRAPAPATQQLVASLVQQIALAIQRAQLRQAERERIKRLTELIKSTEALATTVNEQHLYKVILSHGKNLLRADRALLCAFDKKGAVICPVADHISPEYVHSVREHYRSLPGYRSLSEEHPLVVINDIEQIKESKPQVYGHMQKEGFKNYIVTPITRPSERPLGAIIFYRDQLRPFTQSDQLLAKLFGNQAFAALENARLYASLQQQVTTVEALLNVGIALGRTTEISQMMSLVVKAVTQTMKTERALIFLWSEDKGVYEVRAAVNVPESTWPLLTFRPGESVVGFVAQQQQPLIINDPALSELTRSPSGHIQQVRSEFPLRNVLGVPIVVDGKSVGVLTVDNRQDGDFSDRDQKEVNALAGQLSVALKNYFLIMEARRQVNLLEIVNEIGSKISLQLDPLSIVQSYLQQIQEGMALPKAFIGIIEGEIITFYGYQRQVIRKNIADLDLTRKAITKQQVIVANNVRPSKHQQSCRYSTDVDTAMEVIVPVLNDNQVIAVLDIHGTRPGQYSETDILIMQALGRQIGSSLTAAQDYQEAKRRAKEESTFNSVLQAMTASLDLGQIMNTVLEQLVTNLEVDGASFIVIDDQRQEWRAEYRFSEGGSSESPGAWHSLSELPPSLKKISNSELYSEPYITNDAFLASEPLRAFGEAHHARSWIAVPLFSHSALHAVLALHYFQTAHDWSESEVTFLRRLATPLRLMIMNIELYQETERYALQTEQLVAKRTDTLHRQQRESNAILQNIADGIMITDREGKVLAVNPAFTTITGYSLGDLNSWSDLLSDDDPTMHAVLFEAAAAVQAQKSWQGQVTARRKDGTPYDIDLNMVPVVVPDDKSPARLVWGLHDITELMNLDRVRAAIVSNVSHELRTPLTNFKLYLELLRRGKSERRERYLDILDKETWRLQRLVEQILTFSRIEGQQDWTQRQIIPLRLFVNDLLVSLNRQAAEKELTLSNDVPADLPPVWIDSDHLKKILLNLLTNAIHYTKEGRVWVSAEEKEYNGQAGVAIAVHDTGLGISEEEQKHIFERFYRGHSALESNEPGSGLGLAIVSYILRHYQGDIRVTSSTEGSTFTVWLPQQPGDKRGEK